MLDKNNRITTCDRLKKYDSLLDKPVVETGTVERVIRIYAV